MAVHSGLGDVDLFSVEFYVQTLLADEMVKAGQLSRVEEVLKPKAVRKYWNEVAHLSTDPFVHGNAIRAVKCLSAVGDEPSTRQLYGTILGGMLVGPSSKHNVEQVLAVLEGAYHTLEAMMDMTASMVKICVAPKLAPHSSFTSAMAADPTCPILRHHATRLLVLLEYLLSRLILDDEGVAKVLSADFLDGGESTYEDLVSAAMASPVPGGDKLRCAALRATFMACLASPMKCVGLIPRLATAAFTDIPAVQLTAISLLCDLTFLIPHVGCSVTEDPQAASEGSLCFLPDLLTTTRMLEAQHIVFFALCRLLIYGLCESPEHIIARIACKMCIASMDQYVAACGASFLRQYSGKATEEWLHQEELANGVVQLCVEGYPDGKLSTAIIHPPAALLTEYVDAKYIDVIIASIQENFTSFFGTAVEAATARAWLGV